MKTHRLIAVALVAGPAAALAQSAAEAATYRAIVRTPVGALAPMLTNTLLNRLQNGASLAFRYGNLPGGDLNDPTHAFGVTGILPAGLGSAFRITGGVIARDCAGCIPDLMLGVGGDVRLMGSMMGTTSTSPLFTASIDGELGYGKPDVGSFVTGYVGVPLALVQRGEGMQFVPFITPAFAFSQVSGGGESTSGSRLMIGGGLGIYNTLSSVTINAGVQHQFMDRARNTIGINVLIGGR